jgi:hypothetical protein
MQRIASLATLAGLAVAGCLHARPLVYEGPVAVASTELVPINPDVKTVGDAEQPMFFHANTYWLFHNAHWWSSTAIHGPWTRVEKPPVPIAQIDQPYAYTHYRQDHPAQTASSEQQPAPPELQRGRRPIQQHMPLMPRD